MKRFRKRHDGRVTAVTYRREWIAANGDRITRNVDSAGYRCVNAAGEWMFDAADMAEAAGKYAWFHGKEGEPRVTRRQHLRGRWKTA